MPDRRIAYELCVLCLGSSPSCQRLSALAPELSGPARLGEFLDDTTVALLLADGIVLVNVGDRISVASTHPGEQRKRLGGSPKEAPLSPTWSSATLIGSVPFW